MTGWFPPEGKQAVLTALGSAGTYFGLALGVPTSGPVNLATINEVATPGYARIATTWSSVPSVEPVQLINSNNSTAGPVTADMPPAKYGFLTDVSTGNSISTVHGLTLGTAASGGSLAAGTYYWTVTATNSRGETPVPPTIAGDPTSVPYVSNTVTAGQQQPLSWTAVSGATGYKIYRGTAPNVFGTLVGTVTSGSTVTFTDSNTGTVAATPPSASSATVGRLLYIWELDSPIQALNGKPIIVPIGGLIVE